MAIASIKAWLKQEQPNYQTGVALYEQYGDKLSLKIFFKAGNSAYHQQRLREALEELSETTPKNTATATATATQKPATATATFLPPLENIPVPQKRHSLTDEEWEKAPDQIKDLYTKVSRLKSRSDMAFHQLFIATSDAQRLELALSRLRDNREINETWKLIKEYRETGKVTEQLQVESVKEVSQLSIRELFAVVTNYPTYITKAKKRIKKYTGQKKMKAERELQEKEIYLAAAKRRVENE